MAVPSIKDMDSETAYKILKIDSEVSREEVDNAYRRMVRRYPPEFRPKHFSRIRSAYEHLTSLKRQVEDLEKDGLHGFVSLPGIQQDLPDPLPPLRKAPSRTSEADWQPLKELLSQALLLNILRRHLRAE